MKTIVIYESKNGYTENYAKVIANKLEADVYNFDQVSLELLEGYDTVIFGGGVYSDKINGLEAFIKLVRRELDKKVIIFGVGMSPIFEEYINKLYKENIENRLIQDHKFFFFRGGVHLDKLSTIERKVLVAFLKVTEIFQESYTEVTSTSKATDDIIDFSSPKFVDELIRYVKV